MRRRRTSSGDEVTLFPFLAVLICTMGSLIVLLVVMVQQAKATAADRSRDRAQRQEAAADEAGEVQLQVEELHWRIEVLQTSRQKTAEDLKTRETELSYIEDEIRQLRARLDRAAEEAGQIAKLAEQESGDQQVERETQDRLREQLDYAREALEQARQQLKQGKRSYALVPYHGASGTRRRPIYIECTSDRVILQPEGVELFSEDFREPLTDDNALASALRAEREYFADATQNRDDPPYPLIIVRPDGAHAYAAARAAMESWDAEFGYELVGEDMPLAFPEVDAALVDVVREAVDEARARRRLLQSIAPARFGRSQPLLTASPTGGFVSQGGDDRGSGGYGAQGRENGPAGRGGSPYGGGPGGAPDFPGKAPTAGFGAVTRGAGPVGSDSMGGLQTGSDVSVDSETRPGQTAGSPLPGHGVGGRGAPGGRGAATDSLNAVSSPRDGAEAASTSSIDARGADVVARGDRNASSSPDGAQSRGDDSANARSGASSGGSATGSSTAANGSAGARSAAAGGAGGASSAGAMGPPSGFAVDSSHLARTRGEDWGLPDRAEGATGITRPINVACYSDRIVVFPEDSRAGRPQELTIQGTLRDEVDELVSKIWQRMESWGIAGNRMYWKPVLQVQVQAGADARYAELAQLLENSGIVVKRK